MSNQTEIFNGFKNAVDTKLNDYFKKLDFETELPFKESTQWITKIFSNKSNEVSLSVSLHHLDYADGISVVLKNKFGVKNLHSEVQNKSKTNISVYLYWVDKVESEMDRILTDFKKNLEKNIID